MNRRAFTLVELLVVITIIGILVSLLMPAVQSARESGRNTTCKNHLKQLGTGFEQYQGKHKYYPSGGWGWGWIGDADRGTGHSQPGAWGFGVLPFIEQQALYELASDGERESISEEQKEGTARMTAIPLETMNCPSRRQATIFTNKIPVINSSQMPQVARTDYAVNGGMEGYYFVRGGESIEAEQARHFQNKSGSHGISYQMSEIRPAHVTDGLSNTYMIGEKNLNPDAYFTGSDGADNESMYSGFNNDNHRSGKWLPFRDTPGVSNQYAFGSSHASGFNMVFCDGHIQMVSFGIDATLHWRLSDRDDGKPANLIEN